MEEQKPITLVRREVRQFKWFGLAEASRRLQVDRSHLSRVLNNKRLSDRLVKKMEKLGITLRSEIVKA